MRTLQRTPHHGCQGVQASAQGWALNLDNKGFENTNLKNILKSLIANAILPILVEKVSVKKMLAQKWGRILNCSSIGVKFGGGVNSYNYALSKHCLEFIPNSYKSWAKKNVFINNLRIGVTNTKMTESRNCNKMSTQDVAGMVKFVLENKLYIPEIYFYVE